MYLYLVLDLTPSAIFTCWRCVMPRLYQCATVSQVHAVLVFFALDLQSFASEGYSYFETRCVRLDTLSTRKVTGRHVLSLRPGESRET